MFGMNKIVYLTPLLIIIETLCGVTLCACPSPDLPKNVYSLTPLDGSLPTGLVLDIVCAPPYNPETTFHITCGADGVWQGQKPDCFLRERKAKWWMLLIGLLSTVVIVPCVLPHIYYAYIEPSMSSCKSGVHKRKESKPFVQEDEIQMKVLPSQFTMKETDSGLPLYPKPLPPIRQKQQ